MTRLQTPQRHVRLRPAYRTCICGKMWADSEAESRTQFAAVEATHGDDGYEHRFYRCHRSASWHWTRQVVVPTRYRVEQDQTETEPVSANQEPVPRAWRTLTLAERDASSLEECRIADRMGLTLAEYRWGRDLEETDSKDG